MNARVSGYVFLSLVVLLAATACSSSSSGSGLGASAIYCSASIAGSPVCYGYSNLNSDQQTAVTNSCKQTNMGSIVSSCPTAGLVGCCKSTIGGINTETCYYDTSDAGSGGDAGAASTDQMSCTQQMGTWSTSQ